ncbi:MAG: ATP-binding protein [Acidimicrobiia bacterium]
MAKNQRLTEQSVQHTAEAVRVGGLSPSTIRHRFGQPTVRLTWTRTGDTVEFQVTDAGNGPDPDLAGDRLFGDWGKGGDDETMTPGMGTRLGLLQARLLTELSGGELTLHRTDTEWAFTMRISEPSSITPRRGRASSRRQTPVATSQDRGPRAKSSP